AAVRCHPRNRNRVVAAAAQAIEVAVHVEVGAARVGKADAAGEIGLALVLGALPLFALLLLARSFGLCLLSPAHLLGPLGGNECCAAGPFDAVAPVLAEAHLQRAVAICEGAGAT